MKKIIPILMVFAFVAFLVNGLYAAPATATAKPDVDGRYLESEVHYTLNTDGSVVKEVRFAAKPNTYYATQRLLGETFITYNPQFQKLEILESHTIMADGKKVVAPKNAFNEVLPRSAQNIPHYSHLREMVVTHTALERGCVTYLHYRITTKPGFMPYFTAMEHPVERLPVDSYKLTVTLPPGKKLAHQVAALQCKPTAEKQNDDSVRFTFAANNLEPFFTEPETDALPPTILLSTAAGWNEVFPPLTQMGPLPEELIKKAEELKKETHNKDELYFKLQKLVADDMVNSFIPVTLTGSHLRTNQEIYASNMGLPIEKAYLLFHLFTHLEIPVELTAHPAFPQFIPRVPTILQVEEYKLRAREGYTGLFITTTHSAQHFFPPDEGKGFVTIPNGSLIHFKSKETEVTGCTISGKLKLDEKECKGTLNVSLAGPGYTYRSIVTDGAKAIENEVGKRIPISNIKVQRISRISREGSDAVVAVDGKLFKDGPEERLLLPQFVVPFINADMAFLRNRTQPLKTGGREIYRLNLELELSKDYAPAFTAKPINLDNAVARYTRSVSKDEKGILLIQMTVEIKNDVVAPADFPKLEALLNQTLHDSPLLILKKTIEK